MTLCRPVAPIDASVWTAWIRRRVRRLRLKNVLVRIARHLVGSLLRHSATLEHDAPPVLERRVANPGDLQVVVAEPPQRAFVAPHASQGVDDAKGFHRTNEGVAVVRRAPESLPSGVQKVFAVRVPFDTSKQTEVKGVVPTAETRRVPKKALVPPTQGQEPKRTRHELVRLVPRVAHVGRLVLPERVVQQHRRQQEDEGPWKRKGGVRGKPGDDRVFRFLPEQCERAPHVLRVDPVVARFLVLLPLLHRHQLGGVAALERLAEEGMVRCMQPKGGDVRLLDVVVEEVRVRRRTRVPVVRFVEVPEEALLRKAEGGRGRRQPPSGRARWFGRREGSVVCWGDRVLEDGVEGRQDLLLDQTKVEGAIGLVVGGAAPLRVRRVVAQHAAERRPRAVAAGPLGALRDEGARRRRVGGDEQEEREEREEHVVLLTKGDVYTPPASPAAAASRRRSRCSSRPTPRTSGSTSVLSRRVSADNKRLSRRSCFGSGCWDAHSSL